MISATTALQKLRDGNRAFVEGEAANINLHRPDPSVTQQSPFAIVLGCSDSRVPVEIIFNQGLGDLFVIRVAGNVITPSLVGSVEYAAANFDTKLVVVLGHSHCGAVTAAVNQLGKSEPLPSPNLTAIVDRILPAIQSVAGADADTQVSDAVRANIRASTEQLHERSEILSGLAEREGLVIVGAEYNLATGAVDFFDTEPTTAR